MGLQYALMYFSDVMGRLDLKNSEEIPKITLAGLQKDITHILYSHIVIPTALIIDLYPISFGD